MNLATLLPVLLTQFVGTLPWLLGCATALTIVLVHRSRLGSAARPAVSGFVLLLATALCGVPVFAYLQSGALLSQHGLSTAEYGLLFGAVSVSRSLLDAFAMVLIGLAVVRGRGERLVLDTVTGSDPTAARRA